MKIYLAGIESLYDEEKEYIKNHPINGLVSFYNVTNKTEDIIPFTKSFLLDSGAFSLFKTGKKREIDWDGYIKNYANFIKKNKVNKYFELDIDVLVGYEKVLDLRHKLEDLVGLPTIPVWHRSRGLENFLTMCEEYKYVAIGGMVSDKGGKMPVKALSYLIREAHRRKTQIHGLGCTGIEKIRSAHFDTVDSSSWLAGNRYGFIYYFDGKTMKHKPVPQNHRIGKDKVKASRLNSLREWAKFSDYAEYKL